jgi:hypothetical protein
MEGAMLILNPRSVRFGTAAWDDVESVVIDRAGTRVVEEWGDLGPYEVLADVPEQRVTVRVVQAVHRDDVNVPRPGEQDTLMLFTAPEGNELKRKKVTCVAVVKDVSHELSFKKGALRTVTLVAVSSDGAADPIVVTDAPGATG